jgi:hypothetical protein
MARRALQSAHEDWVEDPILIASLKSAVNEARMRDESNEILNAHVKKENPRNEVVRVLGDGRCLFHAVAVGMRAQGRPCDVSQLQLGTVACLRSVGLHDTADAAARNDYILYDERIISALVHKACLARLLRQGAPCRCWRLG